MQYVSFIKNNRLIVPAPSMDTIQPHISVCLVLIVIYAAIEDLPVILEQYNRLPRTYAETDQRKIQSRHHEPPTTPVDLAEKVHGMYRLLDVVSESGSNGHGKVVSNSETLGSARRITVDKAVIAQESLQRFINAISPGAYASITKVDFKMLDRFMIKPLGVYGSKHEIVKLLQSIGAVDDNM
jgi:hypothetical protein